ncbi:hypothetical protein Leryth_027471 [Lithospermum erythrorhizon]|nr:hypothetical protein Leryth_027471 [Lithospermum erythrorhizon]
MWMMGYNDGSDFNMGDAHPFGNRKLRPLIPRPSLTTTTANPPCISRIHGTDFIAVNHHHHLEQSKREFNTQTQVLVSSRWNPTPEQLQTLEELYRRGTRTPSAEQIQHITSQLRRFGKIEGKNVFYWFQNHKARERQKRRRQLEPSSDNNEQPPNNNTNQNIEKKESGSSRTVMDIEETMNWATPTKNCSSTLPEKTVPNQTASSKTGAERTGVECRGAEDGWLHTDDNLQQQRSRRTLMIMERNDTWQNLTNSTTIAITAPCTSPTVRIIDPKPNQEYVNIFLDSPSSRTTNDNGHENSEVCIQESPTLQLFPLRSEDDGHGNGFQGRGTQIIGSDESMNTPYRFFEFLPLKN